MISVQAPYSRSLGEASAHVLYKNISRQADYKTSLADLYTRSLSKFLWQVSWQDRCRRSTQHLCKLPVTRSPKNPLHVISCWRCLNKISVQARHWRSLNMISVRDLLARSLQEICMKGCGRRSVKEVLWQDLCTSSLSLCRKSLGKIFAKDQRSLNKMSVQVLSERSLSNISGRDLLSRSLRKSAKTDLIVKISEQEPQHRATATSIWHAQSDERVARSISKWTLRRNKSDPTHTQTQTRWKKHNHGLLGVEPLVQSTTRLPGLGSHPKNINRDPCWCIPFIATKTRSMPKCNNITWPVLLP